MTNDELEAVRARVRHLASFIEDDDESPETIRAVLDALAASADDVPDLLDEVERLRSLVGELEFLRAEDEASFRNTEARATRAEAHVERSDELISRIEGQAMCVAISGPDEWGDMLLNIAQWITAWRMEQHPKNVSALATYRSEKDEACSRPSDALDAPVADQSTTCSLSEKA